VSLNSALLPRLLKLFLNHVLASLFAPLSASGNGVQIVPSLPSPLPCRSCMLHKPDLGSHQNALFQRPEAVLFLLPASPRRDSCPLHFPQHPSVLNFCRFSGPSTLRFRPFLLRLLNQLRRVTHSWLSLSDVLTAFSPSFPPRLNDVPRYTARHSQPSFSCQRVFADFPRCNPVLHPTFLPYSGMRPPFSLTQSRAGLCFNHPPKFPT